MFGVNKSNTQSPASVGVNWFSVEMICVCLFKKKKKKCLFLAQLSPCVSCEAIFGTVFYLSEDFYVSGRLNPGHVYPRLGALWGFVHSLVCRWFDGWIEGRMLGCECLLLYCCGLVLE